MGIEVWLCLWIEFHKGVEYNNHRLVNIIVDVKIHSDDEEQADQ